MIIELEPIFNNIGMSHAFDYPLDLSDAVIGGTLPFCEPVRVSGRVYNAAGVVHVEATARFEMHLLCDRCACDIDKSMSVAVEHVLVTQLNDETNDELILLDSTRFDLDSLVRDDIFLSFPSKFLCSDDCKGICPQCGKNLNQSQCSCRRPIDPRLEALKQLLDKEEN